MKMKDIKRFAVNEKKVMKERLEREEFQAKCDHKLEKKGKIKSQLVEVPNESYCKCRLCGARVDFDVVSQKELAQATKTFERALQQFKAITDDIPEEVLNNIAFGILLANRLEDIYGPVRKELSVKDDTFSPELTESFGNYDAGGTNAPLFTYKDKKHKNKGGKKKNKKNKGYSFGSFRY